MSDDLSKTGHQDDIRINRDQDHELAYWARKLDTSPEELVQAIDAAGPFVKDIKEHLKK